jgi:glycosyltransferase involved in cell wall biosynthesis
MSVRPFHILSGDDELPATSPRRAVLVSSYRSGATEGNRLGTAGYSYDFVARLFTPLLERLGKVIEVKSAPADLTAAAQAARQSGLDPVHVTFRPFQDVCLTSSAPNVVVPAWEFPDVPDRAFDGNPQNNWIETANRCSLVLVGGPFTADALARAGVTTPIRIVPVPTPETYFEMPRWQSDGSTALDCPLYVFPEISAVAGEAAADRLPSNRGQRREATRSLGRHAYRQLVKPCLPPTIEPVVTAALRAGALAWQGQHLPYRPAEQLRLSGVVYTSIFNPEDGRKNWEDMITAFLHALRDQEDATLVLKLIARNPQAISRVLAFYRRLDVTHRCRVVLLPGFLSESHMLELARASTYYITTTRAEGNCLPLMNYLAAGRPSISPRHTAIGDYFDSEVGFVVDSHPEPCAWPQDSRQGWRTSWHRLVWTSLVEQIRESYRIATADRAAYETRASAARERMRQWAHPEAVWPQLRSALDLAVCRENMEAESQPTLLPFSAGKSSRRPVVAAPAKRTVISLLNFRPGKIGGTETYLRRLIPRLPMAGGRHEIVLLMDRDLAAEDLFPGMERAVVDMSAAQVQRARGLEAISPYRCRLAEKALADLRPDVVFFPQQSIFPKNVPAPCALVVHDLYHIFLPQYLSPVQRVFRRRNYAYSIARAEQVIAISHFTKKTILAHYDVDPARIAVVPHGFEADPAGACDADPEIGGMYLYYPAITRPHKNHQALFESIAALRAEGRFDHRLILSGIQTPYWKTLQQQIHRLGLEPLVEHVGYLPYERVRRIYHGAECIVFPSLFEGFGLPVMEAFEAGKKVVVSRHELFDELGVPPQFQIDFSDPAQLRQAIAEPKIAGLTHRPWTWDESAEATMTLLDSAAAEDRAANTLARAA